MKEKIVTGIRSLIILFIIAVFGIFPYLNNRAIYAHDLGYHLNRIMSLENNIRIGQIPSMIHSNLLGGLGYANPLFYPELFMYIPAILKLVSGLHVLTIYKIFLILINMATFASMFYATNKIFGKKKIGFLAAILYSFSLYRLTDIFIRGAIGELLAFVFLPLIVCGLHEIIFGENKKWWILVIGISGLAYSHLLSFIFSIIFIVVICVLNINVIFKDKKKFLNLLIAAILSVLITLAFFGQMLEQKLNYKFYVDFQTADTPEDLEYRATGLTMLFSNNIVGGYATNSSLNPGCMSEGIGIALIIFGALFMFRKNISYKENKFEIQCYAIGMILFLMTTKLFPWDKVAFLSIIQFPFRLNMFPCLIFALVGANSFYELINEKDEIVTLASIVLIILAGLMLDKANINFNPDLYSTYENLVTGVNQEIASKEYLPEGTDLGFDLEDVYLYNLKDQDTKIQFNQVGSTITFDYKNENPDDIAISIPLLYYKGYVANAINKSGENIKLNVDRNEDTGHVLLTTDSAIDGTITVKYKMTIIQIVTRIISLLSVVFMIGYIIFNKIRRK